MNNSYEKLNKELTATMLGIGCVPPLFNSDDTYAFSCGAREALHLYCERLKFGLVAMAIGAGLVAMVAGVVVVLLSGVIFIGHLL